MWVWEELRGSTVYVLFRTIDEALFLNILVLQLKGLLFLSVFLKHSFFLSKISLLSLWRQKKKKRKYSDYCYKDGGKGLILLSLKCFWHCSNVFSVTETYLECFSFPLINCNSWNTDALKSFAVRLYDPTIEYCKYTCLTSQ